MNIRDQTIPIALRGRLSGYSAHRVLTGRSSADVFRMSGSGLPPLFLKREPVDNSAEIETEAIRLRWLRSKGIPCPDVVEQLTGEGSRWLLATEVDGIDIASAATLTATEIIEIAADGLRRLHTLDAAECPFDERLDRQMRIARERIEADLVDESDFDETRHGQTARQVFAELLARRPPSENIVVTHGDATFENLIERCGRFSGFIDCGRLGIADRYRDLALVARSIEDRLGACWVASFFEIYGQDVDDARLEFYQMLDEFF